jgi:siderophore synthetase component/RimJ/RimL family protein N-acetyltransferase
LQSNSIDRLKGSLFMLPPMPVANVDLAAQCFFNGLIKELDQEPCVWTVDKAQQELLLPLLKAKATLKLPYQYLSVSGPHEFRFPCLLKQGNTVTECDFASALALILDESHIVGDLSSEQKALFTERVLQSHENTAFSLKQRQQELSQLFTGQLNFIEAEQALFIGHNMHPAPKSRSGFSPADFCYAPESGEAFALHWFALAPHAITGEMHKADYRQTIEQIVADLGLTAELAVSTKACPSDFQLMPVHPWQAKILLQQAEIKSLISQGDLKDLGQQGGGWRATTSLRAIYHPNCRFMLKFSLSVKLTNSIRHLSEKEVQRGMLLEQILDTQAAQEFSQRYPDFTIMGEPGFAAITSASGILEQSLVAFRVNPFMANPDRQALVLASLTQANPLGGNSMLANIVSRYSEQQGVSQAKAAETWFGAYLEKVLEPLLVARSDYGLIFLAHQQNIVVDLVNGIPAGLFYRDCQGTGFTCAAKECFPEVLGDAAPENFMPHQYVNPFISYYLIFNSSFSVISALSSTGLIDESRLLAQFRLFLGHLAQKQYLDNSFISYLLDSHSLIFKGNFFVYLSNINENTIEDPSTIYREIANPLRQLQADNTKQVHVKRLPDNRLLRFELNEQLSDQLNAQSPDFEASLSFIQHDSVLEVVTTNASKKGFDTLQMLSIIEHLFYLAGHKTACSLMLPLAVWQRLCFAPPPAWMQVKEAMLVITQGQFEQSSALWLVNAQGIAETTAYLPVLASTIQASQTIPVTHPQRPTHPQGIFYRRFNYELAQEVSFKLACADKDLKLFHQWMNQPRVASFWELDKDQAELKTYLENALNTPHQFPVIAMLDGITFGYFELYWAKEDRLGAYYEAQDYDRGMHLLIGNEAYLGSQYWRAWGQALRQYCFISDPRTQRLVGEPRVDNARLIKIWQYFGYQKIKEFDFPHKRSSLVMLTRDDAFFPKKPVGL